MKNTTFVGKVGEDAAADYLKENGYKILERNAKICGCEIDIICEAYIKPDGSVFGFENNDSFAKIRSKLNISLNPPKNAERTIVFCEVKTRYGNEYGSGAEAVTPYKIGRYVTAARAYMSSHKNVNCNARFDIIEVGDGGINHIVDAFTASDARYPYKRR